MSRWVHEPRMLLLDEPFGALDAFTREELWCILRDLKAEGLRDLWKCPSNQG